ncbi:MAG: signal peptidase II [Peptoniphilaceae bacterium]|nr:signal peptidase II [Peptoniphilaceae bacterium]MDD7383467.1 signal peptidase II [Peptoniphilaceae bacterium]MDY3738471.1 signal peptidase II [Peptoniphilaceae bacterium]
MIYFLIIILGIVIDRISKIYAYKFLIENTIKIPLFSFYYLENKGAAFGILQNHRFLFLTFTILVIVFLLFYFIKNRDRNSKFIKLAISFIISGALGNLYDRIVSGYVIDFIYTNLFPFAVFNFADVFVVLGCIMMIIYLFLEDDNDSKHRK